MIGVFYLLSWWAAFTYLYLQCVVSFVDDELGQSSYALYPATIPVALLKAAFPRLFGHWPYMLLGPAGLLLLINRDMMDARLNIARAQLEEDTVDFVQDYVGDALDDAMDPDPGADTTPIRHLQ